ncbi:MAG: carbohydrate ABC transporter permease, partial [Aquiluna sp.]|nr:carbohydrate ABC transporter permease [Aquiluna sp.]
MTALAPKSSGLQLTKGRKKMKDAFSSPWASFAAIVIAIVWTVPTFGLLVTSIRPKKDIVTSGWWTFFTNPNVTGSNYESVFLQGNNVTPPLSQYFFNSFAITIPAAVFPLTIAVFAAYALAWFEFKGRDFIFFTIFALQVIPLQLTLIPLLQLFARGEIAGVQVLPDLGITGSYIPIWIAHTIFGLPLAIFLLHNFLRQIPRELVEA